jgi:hypothetical protein
MVAARCIDEDIHTTELSVDRLKRLVERIDVEHIGIDAYTAPEDIAGEALDHFFGQLHIAVQDDHVGVTADQSAGDLAGEHARAAADDDSPAGEIVELIDGLEVHILFR